MKLVHLVGFIIKKILKHLFFEPEFWHYLNISFVLPEWAGIA
jgi:hypothetical protein